MVSVDEELAKMREQEVAANNAAVSRIALSMQRVAETFTDVYRRFKTTRVSS